MAKKMTEKKTATANSQQRKSSAAQQDECANSDVAGACGTEQSTHVHPAETKSEEHMRSHPRPSVDEARRRGESIDEETLDRSAPYNKTYGTNTQQKSENEHTKQ